MRGRLAGLEELVVEAGTSSREVHSPASSTILRTKSQCNRGATLGPCRLCLLSHVGLESITGGFQNQGALLGVPMTRIIVVVPIIGIIVYWDCS